MWIIEKTICKRTGKPYADAHPEAICSNCGVWYSYHWLKYIGNQANRTMYRDYDTLPQYCPECGYNHEGKQYNRLKIGTRKSTYVYPAESEVKSDDERR